MPACPRIPYADGVIPTATGECLSIGTERYAGNRIRMPREGVELTLRPRIPDTDRVIPTATDKQLPIGTERYAKNPTRMLCEGI